MSRESRRPYGRSSVRTCRIDESMSGSAPSRMMLSSRAPNNSTMRPRMCCCWRRSRVLLSALLPLTTMVRRRRPSSAIRSFFGAGRALSLRCRHRGHRGAARGGHEEAVEATGGNLRLEPAAKPGHYPPPELAGEDRCVGIAAVSVGLAGCFLAFVVQQPRDEVAHGFEGERLGPNVDVGDLLQVVCPLLELPHVGGAQDDRHAEELPV